jgi:uncharacterized membrane protein YgaE (UPF0421/DUF939 family)
MASPALSCRLNPGAGELSSAPCDKEATTIIGAELTGWLGRHRAEARLSLRITVAGLLTFALVHVLELHQGYWAVLTAVIVIQGNVGGSLKAAVDRLVATLGGGAYGVLVALAIPQAELLWRGLSLGLLLAPLAFLAALRPGLRPAPVTAIIVLLGSPSQVMGVLPFAIERVVEIGLGGAIGFAVSLLVVPTRAHAQLAEFAGHVLDLLAGLTPILFGGLTASRDPAAVQDFYRRIRAALAGLDTVAQEARRESASFLTGEADPEPQLRTIRRLRHDFVMIDRATREPIVAAIADVLSAPLDTLAKELAAALRQSADALRQRRPLPVLGPFRLALNHYRAAMAEVRNRGLTRELSGDATARIFGLAFALEQLDRNLEDLAPREAKGRKQQPANRQAGKPISRS